ncbi:cytosine permease [Homoserinimonas sp. A447]
MEQDDGAGDGRPTSADGAGAGPRRATFTPPLADAYAQFSRSGFQPTQLPDAPPPNPATVVTPPPGSAFPRPPERRSLDDDHLVATLDKQGLQDGGVLEAIEQLQAQLRIREQEAREFRNWESSMLAIGTPEALDVVEETRVTFTGAIQIIPPSASAPVSAPISVPPDASASAPSTAPDKPEPVVYDLVEPEEPPHATGSTVLAADVPSASATDSHAGEEDDEDDVDDDDDDVIDVAAPAAPVGSPRTEPGEVVIVPEPVTPAQRVFGPEPSGAEPTLPEQRTGRALRLFWLWFAANSSVLSIVFGGVLMSLGMSLRQSIVAALAGVALSFLPIGLGTLAGKWSGQPTIIASRATFGLIGNAVPGILALVTRLLWGGVLLWLLASVTAGLLVAARADGGLSTLQLTIATAGIGFLIALVVAFFGYRLLAKVQLVLSVASAALVIGLIMISWPLVDVGAALTIGDGPWVLVLTGAILVFSFVGLVWSTSAGDLARYQRPSNAAAGSMLTASFGNALPAFVLIAYGALLAASNPSLASGFVDDPIATLTELVPAWFMVPLVAAVGIGLLSGVILSIYSGGFALVALAPLRRELAVLAVGTLLGALTVVLVLTAADLAGIFRDVATTLAVPTAAWLGIFTAEVMIRNRRFDTRSLVQRGGTYADFRWVNLGVLVAASAVGYGFTTASVDWLAWQGYLLQPAGMPLGSDLAQSDVGVLVALGIAILMPILVGIGAVRRQESVRG